jgi:hypothetical protein
MTNTETIETLTEYGNELVAAGFEVWLHKFGEGYLTYRNPETGNAGSLQYSLMEGWQHLMPIVPSREYGSAMHLDTDTDPWTVQAARECAADTNYNDAVRARLANAKGKTWRSADAIPLHAVSA